MGVALSCWGKALALTQSCFEVNVAGSTAILSSGSTVALPAPGQLAEVPCTETIRNFTFKVRFAPGTETYFEDSTQFNAVLLYKNSTFILKYDRYQNIFQIVSDQQIGEGSYTLTLSSIMCSPAAVSCQNCFFQYSFEVRYVNDPNWSVVVTSDPDPARLTCFPGSQVILEGSPLPHSGFQAQWAQLLGTQFIDIAGATAVTYIATREGTYLYKVQGPGGCQASNLIVVKPSEKPVIEIAAPQQKINSCSQALEGISVTDSSAPNNLVYSWTALQGGVILKNENTLAPVVGTPGIYVLIVQRLDNGCADTAAVNVLAGDIPLVQVSIESASGTDVLSCRLPEIKLYAKASTSRGGATFTFLWSIGDTSEEVTVTQPGVYSVTVVEAESGCVGYADRLIFKDTQLPVAMLFSSRDTVCAGESAVLSVVAVDHTTFRWPDGSTANPLTVVPAADGPNIYAVLAENTLNGCTATITKTIIRMPYPVLTCLPDEITVHHGQTASLNCTTQATAQLQWSALSTNVLSIPASGIGPVQGRLFELSALRAPGQVDFLVFARQGTCVTGPVPVKVQVIPPTTLDGLYIPEIITPDGDDQNDVWDIVLPADASPSAYSITLYNRHGALIWQGSVAAPFPAERYPDGVYLYVITPPDAPPIRGAVTILRRRY